MNCSDLNPSPEEIAAICAGNHSLFDALLKNWLPSIRDLAAGFTTTAFDRDDYVQVGSLTLFDVCHTFPTDSPVPFERYARRAIKFGMIDAKRADRTKTRSVVTFVKPSELTDPEVSLPGPVEGLIEEEEQAAVCCWAGRLQGRDREIIHAVYWRDIPQAAVARLLGLTPARVSQIHNALLCNARRTFQWAAN